MDDSNDNLTVTSTSNEGRPPAMVRVRYHELHVESDELEANNGNSPAVIFPKLCEKLVEQNALFQECSKSDGSGANEMALDSSLMLKLMKIGNRTTKKLDTNIVTFIPSELTSRIKVIMRSREEYEEQEDNLTLENWVEFGKSVSKLFRRPPKYNFLLGAFPKVEEKVTKQRKPKDKAIAESQKTAPENISAMGTSNQEVTSEEVERVLSVLRSYCQQFGSVLFFEFVTDPNSFSRTIENIFHVTFLIKNGFVKLYEDDDELLTLEVVQDKTTKSSSSSNPDKKNETLLSITQKDWREIIKAYKIEKAILEPRSNSNKRVSD